MDEKIRSNVLNVNLGKTKVVFNGSIIKDGLSESNVDSCGACSSKVKANSVLCAQCQKLIRST